MVPSLGFWHRWDSRCVHSFFSYVQYPVCSNRRRAKYRKPFRCATYGTLFQARRFTDKYLASPQSTCAARCPRMSFSGTVSRRRAGGAYRSTLHAAGTHVPTETNCRRHCHCRHCHTLRRSCQLRTRAHFCPQSVIPNSNLCGRIVYFGLQDHSCVFFFSPLPLASRRRRDRDADASAVVRYSGYLNRCGNLRNGNGPSSPLPPTFSTRLLVVHCLFVLIIVRIEFDDIANL